MEGLAFMDVSYPGAVNRVKETRPLRSPEEVANTDQGIPVYQ